MLLIDHTGFQDIPFAVWHMNSRHPTPRFDGAAGPVHLVHTEVLLPSSPISGDNFIHHVHLFYIVVLNLHINCVQREGRVAAVHPLSMRKKGKPEFIAYRCCETIQPNFLS